MAAATIGCICGRSHRSYEKAAWCRWPKAWWVTGEGPFALIANCGDYYGHGGVTVTLWSTLEQAEAAADGLHCGSRCVGEHEIRQLPA